MKRVILIVLMVVLLLPAPVHSAFWFSDDKGYKWVSLPPGPLPPGYETCHITGIIDYRTGKSLLWRMDWWRTAAGWTLNAALGMVIGGYFYPGVEAVRPALVVGYLSNALTDLTGYGLDQLLGMGNTPAAVRSQAQRLTDEFGISDHYLFGTTSNSCGPDHRPQILALGANISLTMLHGQARPAILRVARPEIDFGRIDARVREKNPELAVQSASIKKVFGYETFRGQRTLLPNNYMWPLPVIPYYADAGKVTGKVQLTNQQGLGYSGVREIHLASPINRGMLQPKPTDTLPVIVLNQETVAVKVLNMPEVEAGKNLHLGVHIRNFHPGTRMDPALPYFGFANWQKMADAVFEGISCRGAGVSRTVFQLNPGFTHTDVWCTPGTAGNVQLFMKTVDGEVLVGNVTVPAAKVPKPFVEDKPGPVVPPKKTLSPDGILGLWYATTSGKAPLRIWKEGDTYLGMITGPGGNGYGWKRDTVSFRLKYQKQEGNTLVYSGKHNQKVGNPYDNFSEWRDITLSYFLIGTEEVFGSVMISGGERFKRQPGR